MIKNNKEFFDQSLDEIKMLRYINVHGSSDGGVDQHCMLELFDYFYYREHLFIVTVCLFFFLLVLDLWSIPRLTLTSSFERTLALLSLLSLLSLYSLLSL